MNQENTTTPDTDVTETQTEASSHAKAQETLDKLDDLWYEQIHGTQRAGGYTWM